MQLGDSQPAVRCPPPCPPCNGAAAPRSSARGGNPQTAGPGRLFQERRRRGSIVASRSSGPFRWRLAICRTLLLCESQHLVPLVCSRRRARGFIRNESWFPPLLVPPVPPPDRAPKRFCGWLRAGCSNRQLSRRVRGQLFSRGETARKVPGRGQAVSVISPGAKISRTGPHEAGDTYCHTCKCPAGRIYTAS